MLLVSFGDNQTAIFKEGSEGTFQRVLDLNADGLNAENAGDRGGAFPNEQQ